MASRGISLAGQRPKHLRVFTAERFDYVITLCDRVREACPEFPGHPGYHHWSIPDPAAAGGSDQDTYPAFEQMAAELETRIRYWLAAASAETAHPSTREA
jgi:ArsR family transcriptional regulator, arsenate/arsenite/antimonite-responsive transcriptional repressor / arsenate reductase (thioredoxin)